MRVIHGDLVGLRRPVRGGTAEGKEDHGEGDQVWPAH